MNLLYTLINKYSQLLKYGLIGSVCAGLDFLIYTLLTVSLNIPYLVANIISVNCGIILSFSLNRHFTFKVKDKVGLRFLSFYLVGTIGLVISSGLLILFVENFKLNELLSKIITVIFVALIQFLLNKYISFNHGKR